MCQNGTDPPWALDSANKARRVRGSTALTRTGPKSPFGQGMQAHLQYGLRREEHQTGSPWQVRYHWHNSCSTALAVPCDCTGTRIAPSLGSERKSVAAGDPPKSLPRQTSAGRGQRQDQDIMKPASRYWLWRSVRSNSISYDSLTKRKAVCSAQAIVGPTKRECGFATPATRHPRHGRRGTWRATG